MTAAQYRELMGLPPAGVELPADGQRGRWGIPARQQVGARPPAAPAPAAAAVPGDEPTPPKRKYRNEPVFVDGEWYDSGKELTAYRKLQAMACAREPHDRIVRVERQVSFEVIPKQDGERRACYVADFVAHTAAGTRRVIDVKSEVTRKLPAYVLKRKLMLQVHDIRIEEW
jgi:hypothetical protein